MNTTITESTYTIENDGTSFIIRHNGEILLNSLGDTRRFLTRSSARKTIARLRGTTRS